MRVRSSRVPRLLSEHRGSLALAVVSLALMPAYVWRWRFGWIPTTTLELSLLATFGVFVLESLLFDAPFVWQRTAFDLPALLLLVAGLISIAASPDHRAALGLFKAYIVEPILFFYLLLAVVTTRARLLLTLGGLAVGGVIVAAFSLAAIAQAVASHQPDIAINPPVAIYQSANDVPLFLVPLLAVAGSLALFGTDRRLRLTAAAFAAIALAANLLSFSRGGYLALLVLLIGFAVAHRRRMTLLAAGIAGIVLVLLVPPIWTRVGHELNLSDPHNSLPGRLGLWSATLHMLHDHPLFGTGLGGFALVMRAYHPPSSPSPLIYPHNILLNSWSILGLLGLVAFSWLMVAGFMQSLRGWRTADPDLRPVCLGVALALVTMVAHGLVDVPFFKNDLSLEFWTLLGLQWVAGSITQRRLVDRSRTTRPG